MSAEKRVVITVNESQPFETVVQNLKARGLKVEHSLEFTGTVIGSWGGSKTPLQEIDGVVDVADEQDDYEPQHG